jgi:dTDP-4-amino-4,6-dideoxygalactose transaminase
LLLPDSEARNRLIASLRDRKIYAPFHYVPLHSAPAGLKFAGTHGTLAVTEAVAGRLLRMPLWHAMTNEPDRVIDAVHSLVR